MTHLLTVGELTRGLCVRRIGRRLVVLPETSSTNAYALDIIAAHEGPDSDGAVVFAEHQTAGRGRMGRAWVAPRGSSLMFTVLLWESPARFSAARVIMSAALAVVIGIEKSTDVDPVIRWPNDVYVGAKKLAGILVEARLCGQRRAPVAVGIGVNCLQQAGHFPEALRTLATSLEIESRQPVDRTTVARAILHELDALLDPKHGPDDATLADAWRIHAADLGRRITVSCDGETFSGQVIDVNPQSGLVMQLDNGLRRAFDPATVTRRTNA